MFVLKNSLFVSKNLFFVSKKIIFVSNKLILVSKYHTDFHAKVTRTLESPPATAVAAKTRYLTNDDP